jgi:LuxR family maltose regulon positive regulatory protein
MLYMVYARALLVVGRACDALLVLTSLEELVQRPDGLSDHHVGNVFGMDSEILILQAMAHQASGRESEATAKMEQALRQAAPEDSRRVFLEAGPVAGLIRRARRAAPGFADRLLDDVAAEARRKAISDQPLIEPLTAREIEVLHLIATGLRNKEIADQLYLSVGTVKRHISNINGKLGTNNRTQAVACAREMHIL